MTESTEKPTKKKAATKKASSTKAPAKKTASNKAAVKKAAPKKAAPKTAATKKAAPKKAPAKKATAKKTATKSAPQRITHEERWRMVAEAAYLRAEKRHFATGGETDDWLAAEAEVDARLAAEGVKFSD